METKIIFRTRLNSSNDYDKFEVLDSATNLNESDIVKIQEYAEVFYNSTKPTCEDILELSIGHAIIKGSNHPTAFRRKMIEGFIEIEEVIEQAPEPLIVDTRAKELYIKFRKDLFALRQTSDDEDTEQLILKLEKYILNQLENEKWNIEVHDLLIGSPESLKHISNKENTKLIDAITYLQKLIASSKQPDSNDQEAK
jgi:hypothetical protein